MRRLAVAAGLLLLLAVPAAESARGKPLLGMRGDPVRFEKLTGQKSVVMHAFLGWEQGFTWGKPLANFLPLLAPVPMLHLGTGARPPGKREAITPFSIARGAGDAYLKAINRAISGWNRLIYVRPMAEMNNKINYYSYERMPDASHHPSQYRLAFCRIFIILHGGTAAQINARLKSVGLPPTNEDLPVNPYPQKLRVIWNPLAGIESGRGAPAQRYFPGNKCTDMIGNDMFASQVGVASWDANLRLYNAHPSKPYSFPEWGLDGVDDPGFIEKLCAFIKTHRRTELAAYYESKAGSQYDIEPRQKARAAYRKCLTPLGGPAPA